MMECYDPLESPPPEEWLDMDEAEFSASSRTIIVAHYTERVRFRLPVGGWPRSFLSRASDCVEGLERDRLWRPGVVHHAAEAMPFSAYGFFTKSALMVRP